MSNDLLIDTVAKLSLQPGDALVLKTKRPLTADQAQRLREQWERVAVRFGVIAVVLDNGFELEVLTKEKDVA